MTTTQILDALAPYTPDEKRCGYKKKRKCDLRYRLLLKIEKLQSQGMSNEEILKHYQGAITEIKPDLDETHQWLFKSWWLL